MKGNGRMSRLLSLLLLYKNGFDAGRYISFEEKICLSKDDYFNSIRESSVGWHENNNSYFPFMMHFLNTLLLCYEELDKLKGQNRHGNDKIKQIPKNQQIKGLILNSQTSISKQEICAALPDVSPTTVESVLGLMVREALIEKVGSGRSTRYIKTR
jgi:Fic family protein